MVMETEKRDVNIKLVYEETGTSCFNGGSSKLKKQQLLLNILLDSKKLLDLRKQVR